MRNYSKSSYDHPSKLVGVRAGDMRVSEYYELDRTQPELDFVDVDISTDVTVFLDPRAIRIQDSDWAHECQTMLQSFFAEVLEAIHRQEEGRVDYLLGRLSEPNETHLGFSRGRSRGRGLGGVGAEKVAEAITNSRAASTGLLSDLEDSALLVPGIGKDIISDIATHILRGALIGYTQRACEYYGIPLERQHSGHIWNPDELRWDEGWVDLPRADEAPLLLVPKSIVRFEMTLDKDKYYNGFLAPMLESKEIDAGSNLVTILKNGSPKVYRDQLKGKYPANKLAIIGYTQEFPDALPRYKNSISKLTSPVLTHEQLARALDVPVPDYDALLERMLAVAPGSAGATLYHRAAEKLLTALFFPYLGNMRMEREIHEGRKRIDIVYDNLAALGTFYWLGSQYRAAEVPVECKNYSDDLANEQLDQISGRFSDQRGWVGFITCRKFTDKALFLDRCRDTAKDGRGYVIALDDDDFAELVRERKFVVDAKPRDKAMFHLVRERFDSLIR
ncbi:hypothetical protein [Micromonospora aurantiaca (nom. illeg.)]|uniref:hypothetical protein n=1 Tax=Micromonospora aurantiaca (nom. illeg.) TaxID=47850 RepID=UPI003EBAE2C7